MLFIVILMRCKIVSFLSSQVVNLEQWLTFFRTTDTDGYPIQSLLSGWPHICEPHRREARGAEKHLICATWNLNSTGSNDPHFPEKYIEVRS